LEKNPPRVESNIQSSETIIEEEQLEETSWEFFMHLNWFLYYLVEIQYNLYQKVSSAIFQKLRVLDLRSYGQFYSLPEELGDLKDLVCLHLCCCHNLEILPNIISLHILNICLNFFGVVNCIKNLFRIKFSSSFWKGFFHS
jgi:hypothetical protein